MDKKDSVRSVAALMLLIFAFSAVAVVYTLIK